MQIHHLEVRIHLCVLYMRIELLSDGFARYPDFQKNRNAMTQRWICVEKFRDRPVDSDNTGEGKVDQVIQALGRPSLIDYFTYQVITPRGEWSLLVSLVING